ncbi:hypothetical protein [Streptacidiphilus sp. EB129]|uniref:hypothetical protein n=1 Tax=Streptacidiphilus sp. EB129 TaxID=3156262 RepID=UPI0035163BC1
MLTALAEKTGVELARLRSMTLAGWVPWLFDMLPVPAQDAQPVFDTYIRDNVGSVRAQGRNAPRPAIQTGMGAVPLE